MSPATIGMFIVAVVASYIADRRSDTDHRRILGALDMSPRTEHRSNVARRNVDTCRSDLRAIGVSGSQRAFESQTAVTVGVAASKTLRSALLRRETPRDSRFRRAKPEPNDLDRSAAAGRSTRSHGRYTTGHRSGCFQHVLDSRDTMSGTNDRFGRADRSE